MQLQKDGKGQPYIEWQQAKGCWKRAWIQDRRGNSEKDWANTGKYLNVVRCESPGHPGGNPTDFPVSSELSDEQLLRAFIVSVTALMGRELIDD